MAKNIYQNEFKVNSVDERKKLFKERLNNFKSTKKNIVYEGKDNANYEVFETKNPKKDFGKNIYFVDDRGLSLEVYKVKKNLKPYSKFKNSELVYALNVDSEKSLNDRKSNYFKETGVLSSN